MNTLQVVMIVLGILMLTDNSLENDMPTGVAYLVRAIGSTMIIVALDWRYL